jgi:hypothetical protein
VAGDPTTAAAWRAELAALPGEALTGLRAAAAADARASDRALRRPPHANLLLLEAE